MLVWGCANQNRGRFDLLVCVTGMTGGIPGELRLCAHRAMHPERCIKHIKGGLRRARKPRENATRLIVRVNPITKQGDLQEKTNEHNDLAAKNLIKQASEHTGGNRAADGGIRREGEAAERRAARRDFWKFSCDAALLRGLKKYVILCSVLKREAAAGQRRD